MADAPILGIDLGTTFSTAAVVQNGRFHYATDERGEASIPSVVYFPKSGPPLVGAEADRQRAVDPANTVAGVKRLLARALDSDAARRVSASAAFRLVGQGAEEVKVRVRGGDHAASEVAALIVRHLKDRAEQRFGRPFQHAILTVPVEAAPGIEATMVKVGRMAGLKVERVLSEPVAGGLARGMAGANDSGRPRMVFDFGGGTLDVSVLQRKGEQVQVLATGGDDVLGGDDLDAEFSRWVAAKVWGQFQVDVTRDVILHDAILRQCEKVKRLLSVQDPARYLVSEAIGPSGMKRNVDLKVSRGDLKPVWDELVTRAVNVAVATAGQAGTTGSALAQVSLIGGTTFVPQVRLALAQGLRVPLDLEADPQTAVARGAAFLGAFPGLL